MDHITALDDIKAELLELRLMKSRVIKVAHKLKQCRSCVAAVIEAQDCGSTVTAKWAARELRRICRGEQSKAFPVEPDEMLLLAQARARRGGDE